LASKRVKIHRSLGVPDASSQKWLADPTVRKPVSGRTVLCVTRLGPALGRPRRGGGTHSQLSDSRRTTEGGRAVLCLFIGKSVVACHTCVLCATIYESRETSSACNCREPPTNVGLQAYALLLLPLLLPSRAAQRTRAVNFLKGN